MPARLPLPPAAERLLAQFAEFLDAQQLSHKTTVNYLSDVRGFLHARPEASRQVTVVLAAIQEHKRKLLEVGTPLATINRHLASLRQFAAFLNTVHHLEIHPAAVQNISMHPKNGATLVARDLNTRLVNNFVSALRAEHCSPSTIRNYAGDIGHFAIFLEEISLLDDQIKPRLQDYWNFLSSLEESTATLKRRQSSLRKFYSWATASNYLNINPFPPSVPQQIQNLAEEVPNILPQKETVAEKEEVSSGKTVEVVQSAKSVESAPLPGLLSRLFGQPSRPTVPMVVLALLVSLMGSAAYRQFFAETPLTTAFPTQLTRPNRILSFQGRLTDSVGTPITIATNVKFRLFNHITNGTGDGQALWASGTCSITPDSDGVFNTLLGSSCGAEIPASVFSENRDVYLELEVAGETLTPRQQIATVGYALNSETLQGYPASRSAVENTVLVMNEEGDVLLGSSNPRLLATGSGTFTVSADSLTLNTNSTGGDITLSTLSDSATGQVKLFGDVTTQDYLTLTNSSLTTGTMITADVGNDNSGYKFVSFTGGSSTSEKFSVNARGNVFASGFIGARGATLSAQISSDLPLVINGTGGQIVSVTNAGNLSISGDFNTTGTYRINGTDYGQYFIGSAGNNGEVWKSDGTGAGFWGTVSSGSGGTVTSVGLVMPSEFTVTNSPVTSAGNLTTAWASQTANYVFAAPNGSAGTPTFRGLVDADIPDTITASNYVLKAGDTMTGNLAFNTGSITTVQGIGFNTAVTTAPAEGFMNWNDDRGLLEIGLKGGYSLEVGEQIVKLAKNQTGTTIAKGKVVYINGGSGNRPTIALASNGGEGTSSKTFGITGEEITSGQAGYVVVFGPIYGLNTASYSAGQTLYLGTNGDITNTIPTSPLHMVVVAKVVNAHATEGVIEVNIQNGFEIGELHDVLLTATASGDVLSYDAATQLWKNRALSSLTSNTAYLSLNLGTYDGGYNATQSAAINLLASSANTASYLVARDASGNFASNGITANLLTSTGALTLSSGASGNIAILPNGTGSVGIGTSSPTAKLDVAGTASVSGILTVGNGATNQIRSPFGPLSLMYKSGADAWTAGLTLNELGNAVFAGRVQGSNAVNSNEFVTLGQLSAGAGQYWQLNAEVLSPYNSTLDLVLGGTATSGAKFQVLAKDGSATSSGTLTASSFIRAGGTSTQFLKADGSVDSTTYVPAARNLTINGTTYDLSADRSWSVGTVTAVTASAPLSSSGGTTPNITITQAGVATDGYLSSTDWTTFNNKQGTISLTTSGSSGASTFNGSTLNIPNYTLSGLGGVGGTGTANQVAYFSGSSTLTSSSNLFFDGTNVGIGATNPTTRFQVSGNATISGTLRADNYYFPTGGGGLFRGDTNQLMAFGTSNISVNGSYNFGVGTDITQQKLTVVSNYAATPSGFLSTGNMLLGQNEGGAYFGRVGLREQIFGLNNYGGAWTARMTDSARNWESVALSSDGRIQTGVVRGGQIYTSTDYGVTWTARDSSRDWYGVAMSADGKIQTAVVNAGKIYTSIDYGVTWIARGTDQDWWGAAMSSDGKIQTAAGDGALHTSSDYGITWTSAYTSSPQPKWSSVSMSSDGRVQVATNGNTDNNGSLFFSYDYGASWVERESIRKWIDVSVSSDGKIQTAVAWNSYIFTSSDYGVSWTLRDSLREWRSVTMSSDGKIQTAVANNGQVYTSVDYGITWTARDSSRFWQTVAMSSDGKIQTAGVDNGYLYTSSADTYLPYGNVGIGTFTPVADLEVSNADNVSVDISTTGANKWSELYLNSTNTGVNYLSYGANDATGSPLQFFSYKTGVGNVARFTPDGNVGIRTTSPSSILEITNPNPETSPTLEAAGTQLLRYKYGPKGYNTSGAPMVLRYTDTKLLLEGEGSSSYLIHFKARADGNEWIDETWHFGVTKIYNSTWAYTAQRLSGSKTVEMAEVTKTTTNLQLEWYLTQTDGTPTYDDSIEVTVMEVLAGHSEAHDGTFSMVTWANRGSPATVLNNGGNAHATFGGTGTNWIMGNLGVGTISPFAKLEVAAGDIFTYRGRGIYSHVNGTATAGIELDPDVSGSLAFMVNNLAIEAIRIKNDGNVGIGTTTPTGLLHVNGAAIGKAAMIINETGNQNILAASSSGTTRLVLQRDGNLGIGTTTPTGLLHVNGAAIGKAAMIIHQTGNQNILAASASGTTRLTLSNTGTLTVVGTVTCVIGTGSGATNCTSDSRLKTDVTSSSNNLQKILALNPVRYNWISGYGDRNEHLGLIAQEVQQQYPEFVTKVFDDYLGVDYGSLTTPLIGAIKEQNVLIKSLESVSLNASGNVVIAGQADGSYSASLPNGTPVTASSAFQNSAIANLRAGLVDALTLKVDGKPLTQVVQEIVQNMLNSSQVQVLSGEKLNTNLIEANTVRTTTLQATDSSALAIRLDPNLLSITANTNGTTTAVAQFDTAGNATFSGTVFANELNATRIAGLDALLEGSSRNTIELATAAANLAGDSAGARAAQQLLATLLAPQDASTEAILAELNSLSGREIDRNTTLRADALIVDTALDVRGVARLATATVTNTLTVGGNLTLTGTTLEMALSNGSNPSVSDTFYVQPSGNGSLDLLAGVLKIQSGRIVTVDGDLYVTGEIHTKEVLTTSLNINQPATVSAAATGSSLLGALLKTYDEQGNVVAVIDASGSAKVAELNTRGIVIAAPNGTQQTIGGAPAGNATAGKAILPANQSEVVIANALVEPNTLIYLTPLANTQNKVLFVKNKIDGESFTVAVDSALPQDVEFNYWLIKVEQ